MSNRWGKSGNSGRFIFFSSKVTTYGDCSHKIRRYLLLGKKAMINPDSILKSRDITLLTKSYSQSYGLPSSHVWMWELGHREGCVPKNWCFWIVVLEKTLQSPLDCKEIKLVNLKGNTLSVHWKDWCWSWSSKTLATCCVELTHLKRPWCWERLKAIG